jgi:hypothetical protein
MSDLLAGLKSRSFTTAKGDRVSIAEIESRLRSLGSAAQQTVGDQKRSLAAVGVIGGALTVVASYLHGRRRGRRRATVLEIRRS